MKSTVRVHPLILLAAAVTVFIAGMAVGMYVEDSHWNEPAKEKR